MSKFIAAVAIIVAAFVVIGVTTIAAGIAVGAVLKGIEGFLP